MNEDESSTPDARASQHRSARLVGKTYAKGGQTRRPFVARLPEPLYDRLMVASDATGASANTLVTQAVEDYLSGQAFHDRLELSRRRSDEADSKRVQAELRRQEAIRKLAGG